MKLVARGRATGPENFAIIDELSFLDKISLQNIGKTPGYLPRRQFEEELITMTALTQHKTRDRIKQLDELHNNQIYEGGCYWLLKWYRDNL